MKDPKVMTEPCKIDEFGNKYWWLNGQFHREDGPAIEYTNGTKEWFLNGSLHRTDGPAVERPGGTKEWYLNGKLHREDGPAIENSDGSRYWCLNDKLTAKGERPENWDELIVLAQVERVMND